MEEDSWMKCERTYFTQRRYFNFKITEKLLNTIIKEYNIELQRALFGTSVYIAQDLKFTILKAGGGKIVRTEKED